MWAVLLFVRVYDPVVLVGMKIRAETLIFVLTLGTIIVVLCPPECHDVDVGLVAEDVVFELCLLYLHFDLFQLVVVLAELFQILQMLLDLVRPVLPGDR